MSVLLEEHLRSEETLLPFFKQYLVPGFATIMGRREAGMLTKKAGEVALIKKATARSNQVHRLV